MTTLLPSQAAQVPLTSASDAANPGNYCQAQNINVLYDDTVGKKDVRSRFVVYYYYEDEGARNNRNHSTAYLTLM